MEESRFNQSLLDFLTVSTTPFHAVAEMSKRLKKYGFVRLNEGDAWKLNRNEKYFVIRNDASLIAFATGKEVPARTGIRMIGAHTDSPGFKVKPNPEKTRHSLFQLGVEVYGGPLFNPWFDRDLSMAGRVMFLTKEDRLEKALIDFRKPVACIPSLAIHFDREANKNRTVNAQEELLPVLMQAPESDGIDFRELLLAQMKKSYPDRKPAQVFDFDIFLYDTQPPALTGLQQEFLSGGRLDNLLSCFIALRALIDAGDDTFRMAVFNDHEEVGSVSAGGAKGPFLASVLSRICPDASDRARMIHRSRLISADDAHALHPNYASRYDDSHGPLINRGPVIKMNASHRYATDSETAALFRLACRKAGVPVQVFVMRSDLACGSTIGPLTAAQIGVKTVDVGVPIFAMHSVRETAGIQDAYYLYLAVCEFLKAESLYAA